MASPQPKAIDTGAEIERLARQLLGEPFAIEHGLGELDIEGIGHALEAASEEGTPDLVGTDRCKELYCSLLMAIEAGPAHIVPGTPLKQWVDRPEAAAPELEVVLPESIPGMEFPQADDLPITLLPAGHNAKEYLELAHFFSHLRNEGGFPLPLQHLDRLYGQSLTNAIEVDCADSLSPLLARWWQRKDTSIGLVLSTEGGWRAEVRKPLEALERVHSQWLPLGKFPWVQGAHSLRYLSALERPDAYRPSLIDAGILFLLFGHGSGKNGPFRNELGLPDSAKEEIIELAFRLIRLQQTRNRLLTPWPSQSGAPPADGLGRQAEEDAKAILPILARCLMTADETGPEGGG